MKKGTPFLQKIKQKSLMLHKYHLSLNEKLNVGGLMNQVEPIKHKEEIYQMYKVLQERTQRDYLF